MAYLMQAVKDDKNTHVRNAAAKAIATLVEAFLGRAADCVDVVVKALLGCHTQQMHSLGCNWPSRLLIGAYLKCKREEVDQSLAPKLLVTALVFHRVSE